MKKKINISNKTFNLITKKRLKPIPKWEFVIKNWGLWLGLVVCLVLLAIGVGVLWFGLFDNIIVPYLWILVVFIFLGLSYLLFKKTKRAYRIDKKYVVIFISILSIVTGGIIFKSGIANRIDRGLGARSTYYRQIVPMKLQAWNNPKDGYLSGVIVSFTDVNNFEIEDFGKNIWKVEGQKVFVRGRLTLEVGEEIKLIGRQTADNKFVVDEIRPWNGMGQN